MEYSANARYGAHPVNPTDKAVIGRDDDPDFIADLQIIARKEPGKGQALQRMLDRAQTTQTALAESLDVDRSTVTLWCSEKRWPDDTTLRNALLKLNIDRKLILREFGPVLVTRNSPVDPQEIAITVFSSLFAVDDPFEREEIIYTNLREKILIAQGVKALVDTRAADYVEARFMKFTEEKRMRQVNITRNVTPKQQGWANGDVLVKPSSPSATTTSSDEPVDNYVESDGIDVNPEDSTSDK